MFFPPRWLEDFKKNLKLNCCLTMRNDDVGTSNRNSKQEQKSLNNCKTFTLKNRFSIFLYFLVQWVFDCLFLFKLSKFYFSNCQNFLFQTVKIFFFQTVKIFLFKLSKFSFLNCQNFPFKTVKKFLFQTVKNFFFKLSKFSFSNCQNFSFQTVKISF
jgi:hypothetical protein